MKNFLLTVWNANGTVFVTNMGRWNWNANETECADSVKRAAFLTLENRKPEYFWSYVAEGHIEGNAKDGSHSVFGMITMGLTDTIL